MTGLMKRQQIERSKRYQFLGVGIVGLGLAKLVSPFLGIIALGASGYLGYRWFQYRVKNGMRF